MATSDLLVTPAQRDRGVEILKEMYADGRLSHLEFDQRLDQALGAKTRADLNAAFDGLVTRPVPAYNPYVPQAFVRPQVQPYQSSGRAASTFAHWLGYPTFFVGPALVAATAGQRNPVVRKHAIEAVNFQLTVFGLFAVMGVLTGVVGGWTWPVFPILGIAWFLLTGIGGLSAMLGNDFRYPFSLRILR